jgi:ribonuclease P protein component
MSDRTFGKSVRLRGQADFDRVCRSGAFASDDVLVVNGCRNQLAHPRLGISVSRKAGHAVLRNRWKRLIREAFRQMQSTLPAGIDLVVRPRRGAVPVSQAIRESLPRLARRVAARLPRNPA